LISVALLFTAADAGYSPASGVDQSYHSAQRSSTLPRQRYEAGQWSVESANSLSEPRRRNVIHVRRILMLIFTLINCHIPSSAQQLNLNKINQFIINCAQ